MKYTKKRSKSQMARGARQHSRCESPSRAARQANPSSKFSSMTIRTTRTMKIKELFQFNAKFLGMMME